MWGLVVGPALGTSNAGAENGIKKQENCTKMGPQTDAKSMKNPVGVPGAFRARVGRPNAAKSPNFGDPFGDTVS